jgi:capsular polysaccharide export protein
VNSARVATSESERTDGAVPRPRPTVVFVSYFGHHYRLFRLIAKALRPEVSVRHLAIYALRPRAAVERVLHADGVPREIADQISLFDALKRLCRRPQLDLAEVQRRLAPSAASWYRLFQQRLAGADLVVVWGGVRSPLRAATCAAESLGIKAVHCENGLLPDTIAMDPRGVNFASSIVGKTPEFYLRRPVDEATANALLSTALRQRPLRRALWRAGSDTDDGRPLPERYVLFPMQVHDDSQILLFSPRFRTMEEAVRYVAEQVERYNARTGDQLVLVVKEHPSDFGRADYQALRRSLPGVFFLRRTPISQIIGGAEVVVALNSTVGVEGLLFLRPVITLADALYNVPGIARHLEADEELADVLGEVAGRPVDRELITRFLYFLRYEYLVPVSPRTASPETIAPAAQRVVDILHDRLPWAE